MNDMNNERSANRAMTDKNTAIDLRFVRNVVVKALILFILFNVLYTLINPLGWLGHISLYNSFFPGRDRLPFGEDPQHAYNLSTYNLDAMFASHRVSSSKPPDEFRVIVLGDSSVWGTLLEPQQTLSGKLNSANLHTCDGRLLQFYNLGYPTLSLTKDLLLLDDARAYQPDMVVWLVTLESFPLSSQLFSPLVANNTDRIRELISTHHLDLDLMDPNLVKQTFYDRTILGQRRSLADWLRLQMYGVMWSSTGIDQVYPNDYPPAQRDFDQDVSFHDLQPPQLPEGALAWDVLNAGMQAAGDLPLLLINEPILVSSGQNSDLRYNFFYPRWAYDEYRRELAVLAGQNGWHYLDAWDLVPEGEFTNSAIHLTPAGSQMLADRVAQQLGKTICIR
jgi:hypothetical protein